MIRLFLSLQVIDISMFNYLYFGLQPVWFHATNVTFHVISCILFAKVCLEVTGLKSPLAALGGVLFAVHPIHTEAVTGIVGRADLLAAVFFLLSLLAYHGQTTTDDRVWTSVLYGALSMLAKESGITVFLVNLTYDFYLHWTYVKRAIFDLKPNSEAASFAKRFTKVGVSTAILLTLRLTILQGSLPKFSEQDNPAAFHPSFHVRVLTFCYLAAFNMWLLVYPSNLSHDWQMGSIPLVTTLNDPRNFLTCFFFGGALLLTAKCLFDIENHRRAPMVLGFCLLMFPFLPASNLLLTVGFVVAERILYLPSLGCTLLVVLGIQELLQNYYKNRQLIACCVLVLIIGSFLRTFIRNKDWGSRESLLAAGLQTLPHNAKMHYNYANFLRDSSRTELAKSHYYTALKLWPSYASAHNNLGTMLDNDAEAEWHFLAAIRASANHVNAHYNLGKLYRKSNRTYESEKMLRKCVQVDCKFTPAYLELAKLQTVPDWEVSHFLRKVIELNPSDPHYAALFGKWVLNKSYHRLGLQYFWKSLRVSPSYRCALVEVLKLFRKLGQKSRLFQMITRWHIIKRHKNVISRNVYLQDWNLKNELKTKAKIYNLRSELNNFTISYRVDKQSPKPKYMANNITSYMVGHMLDNL
ncbi:protein O-mannosyl-transferase TMTC1-like isoform X2 [Cylas formicarius]|uniref:protein O-mannosyl-transferase TMTC1-like isoform X2 n=1 Tax=Cylas formicarius TaxID=197179 RepID=UPI002958B5B9|nr:protein O-mannosyl-transferase TMTC1-like isoform X2 [Cylas formicarius]